MGTAVDARPDARAALLEGLIDHAPLFPPASLELPEALEEDRRAREGLAPEIYERGFLNLLAAVAFGDEEDPLAEEEPDAFRLDRNGFGWRGRIGGAGDISLARRERLRSIGSCSFFEPVEALERLGVLPL